MSTLASDIQSDVEVLRSAYLAKAADVFDSDPIQAARARILVNRWAQYATVQAAADAGADVTSYTIGGRSVTKGDLRQIADRCASLEAELDTMLGMGGGVLVADLRRCMP